jgi:hypothetical protein
MKIYLKVIIAIAIVGIIAGTSSYIIFFLPSQRFVGTYVCTAKGAEYTMPMWNVGAELEIKSNGEATAMHTGDAGIDYTYVLSYKVNGDNIAFTTTVLGTPITFDASLKDGKLVFSNGTEFSKNG